MFIKEIDNNELLMMYSNCRSHLFNIRRRPQLYTPVSVLDIKKDMVAIESEISSRLPVEFKWEMEKIQLGLCPAGNISPGDWYKHKLVGYFKIQVIDHYEFSGPIWAVRAFIRGLYICRFMVKTNTILEHYERI